jgi:integrase
LRDVIERYRPIAESHKGSQSELSRLGSLLTKVKWVDTPLEYVSPAMVTEWRDARLKEVSSVSVRREMIILGAMFRLAINEWQWMRESPLRGVRRPATSKPRQRGISQEEIDAILAACENVRVGSQVAGMFKLSLETGMRLSELIQLRWSDVAEKYVRLPETKNGDSRDVPLSVIARQVLDERRGLDPEYVFTLSASVASQAFRRARDAAKCGGVHFHDARSEAITRLSKKLDVMQLARMIGHRDLKSLMIYYAESAEDIADRL